MQDPSLSQPALEESSRDVSDFLQDEIADATVKQYKVQWWSLLLCCGALSIAKVVVGDVFGAAIIGSMAMFLLYIVQDDFREMTQYIVTAFGLTCFVNSIFDGGTLILCLRGRRIDRSAGILVNNSGKHPLFDLHEGWIYNAQSVLVILSPCVLLCGALLSWRVHNAYDSSLFLAESEAAPFARFRHDVLEGGYGTNSVREAQASQVIAAYHTPSPNRLPAGMQAFSGQGMRLGSEPA
mmetsp:Transcript_41412/g.75028  ORF Transcript_41412/g.75028 Transcript_41412/m.75028 type:complete len:238 (+) Transcript_41412:105-818(+)